VIVSGKDIWRISQAIEVAPWDFTLYSEAIEGAVDGFQLEPGGPAYQVVLSKRGEVGPQGAPCIFLWKLADGHAQCGLGALRPMVCQAYPALLVDDLLCVESSACTCRRWSTVDLDHDAEVARLEQVLREAAEYSEIVAAWNQGLAQEPHTRTYQEFCAYVLDAYANRYEAV
jgi:Fe-S-cluster containining protein